MEDLLSPWRHPGTVLSFLHNLSQWLPLIFSAHGSYEQNECQGTKGGEKNSNLNRLHCFEAENEFGWNDN
jgi:hypothetical protein